MVQDESEMSCRIVFNAEHDIFKGHFPGQPIVPGVCMVEIVRELLQDRFGAALMLGSARNIKFLQFVQPDGQPTARISWKETPDGYTVSAIFVTGEAANFKLDGSYVPVVSA